MAEKQNKVSRRMVNFEFRELPGKEIFVAGSFNEWALTKKLEDKNGDGIYRCRMMLVPGVYQYKFVIDGEWRIDPGNPNFQPNGFGSLDSVLVVESK